MHKVQLLVVIDKITSLVFLLIQKYRTFCGTHCVTCCNSLYLSRYYTLLVLDHDLTFHGHLTVWVIWPLNSLYTISCGCSIGTDRRCIFEGFRDTKGHKYRGHDLDLLGATWRYRSPDHLTRSISSNMMKRMWCGIRWRQLEMRTWSWADYQDQMVNNTLSRSAVWHLIISSEANCLCDKVNRFMCNIYIE